MSQSFNRVRNLLRTSTIFHIEGKKEKYEFNIVLSLEVIINYEYRKSWLHSLCRGLNFPSRDSIF